ncbi:MAG: uracil-DNA glycosylase family protein [Phycisphaerae bacterium]
MAKQLDSPFVQLVDDLNDELSSFVPPDEVTHVYNPLTYARPNFLTFCHRFGTHTRQGQLRMKKGQVLLLGMNPGPWGMAQTGVPFGSVSMVRDWLKIDEPIGRPDDEHPKRPVQGLACSREEVSGARLWGWAREVFQTPAKFFKMFFVYNYCPLVFMEESGRNRTPDKLPVECRDFLTHACNRALTKLIDGLKPRMVVGVGAFAEKQARSCCDAAMPIGRILHPSPASPLANRDWAGTATRQLIELGVLDQEPRANAATILPT